MIGREIRGWSDTPCNCRLKRKHVGLLPENTKPAIHYRYVSGYLNGALVSLQFSSDGHATDVEPESTPWTGICDVTVAATPPAWIRYISLVVRQSRLGDLSAT